MSFAGNLLKIDGKVIPYIKEYKVERVKKFNNSDTNMNGDVRATVLGIFPSINVTIGFTTQEEISDLIELFDKHYFEVEWFDVREQQTVMGDYYVTQYEIDLLSKHRGIYKPFSIDLLPIRRRNYDSSQ